MIEFKMKNHAYIQARVGSTRFSEKILKEICGKSVLELITERLRSIKNINEVFLITGPKEKNQSLIDEANKINLKYFCGNEENILDRFYTASLKLESQNIIRITGDNLLFDPNFIQDKLDFFIKNNYDFLTLKRDEFPKGFSFEIFKQQILKSSWLSVKSTYNSESEFLSTFISPCVFMEENPKFKKHFVMPDRKYPPLRLTIDYPDDYLLINKIFEKLYPKNRNFGIQHILDLFDNDPKLFKINEKFDS